MLPVQVPTLWLSHSIQNLHKTLTASSCGDEEKGNSPGHVPRQYPCDGTDQGESERAPESNGIGPPVTRIHCEPAVGSQLAESNFWGLLWTLRLR